MFWLLYSRVARAARFVIVRLDRRDRAEFAHLRPVAPKVLGEGATAVRMIHQYLELSGTSG